MSRYALVTGAAGDLGRATCVALAGEGWSILAGDHPAAAAGLAATEEACVAAGAAVGTSTFDVTDPQAAIAATDELARRHGVPTAVVAAAGIQGDFAPVHEHDFGVARRVLEVNVLGVMVTIQASARLMIPAGSGGSIVILASMAGVNGAPNMPAYSASKAALIGLAKAAGRDLAPHGIRVNAVSPAFIGPGAMWDNQVESQARAPSQYFPDDAELVAEQMIASIPLRRYGSPSEVADVIAFLAGGKSSYVTGINVEIAGGAM